MNVYINDKLTGEPIEGAQMFYADTNGDPILVYTPEISNQNGEIDYDQSVSRFVQIEHPHYELLKYEFPEINTPEHIVELMPLFGVQPGEEPPNGLNNKIKTKSSTLMTVAVFTLMGAAAWWLLKSK